MKTISILAAILLSACATTKIMYVKDTTTAQARQDRDECMVLATHFTADIWMDVDEQAFSKCMKVKGYTETVGPTDDY